MRQQNVRPEIGEKLEELTKSLLNDMMQSGHHARKQARGAYKLAPSRRRSCAHLKTSRMQRINATPAVNCQPPFHQHTSTGLFQTS